MLLKDVDYSKRLNSDYRHILQRNNKLQFKEQQRGANQTFRKFNIFACLPNGACAWIFYY